ncbi:MAG: hypothetical protein M1588_01875, partial [Planctomycetes bacterium]|nr:hypothetical protein [Planctomycetota bacterium]
MTQVSFLMLPDRATAVEKIISLLPDGKIESVRGRRRESLTPWPTRLSELFTPCHSLAPARLRQRPAIQFATSGRAGSP